MLDFTSALYLGIQHPSRSLGSWSGLTTGKPAALELSPCAEGVARSLATLQGCERVNLFSSTLHLFFDLFEGLRHQGVRLYVDSGAYPIARWGAERAAGRGVLLRTFPHYDPAVAQALIDKDSATGLRPVILADGYCAQCGRVAPLKALLDCVVPNSGYVVLDDTQALGIFGESPDRTNPDGRGGRLTLPTRYPLARRHCGKFSGQGVWRASGGARRQRGTRQSNPAPKRNAGSLQPAFGGHASRDEARPGAQQDTWRRASTAPF